MASTGDVLGIAQQWFTSRVPYVWGGISQFGADCSGFVKSVYAEAGYTINGRTSQQEAKLGAPVANVAALQPGDLIFYNYEGANSHVAIYAGNNKQYAEADPAQGLVFQPIDTAHISALRRYITPGGAPAGAGVTVSAPVNPSAPAGTVFAPITGGVSTTGAFGPIGGFIDGITGNVGPSASSVVGDIFSPLITFFDDYAIRAALFVFGAAAIIIGLYRIVGSTEAGQEAEASAKKGAATAGMAAA
jgi:hypothetical protein